MGGRLTLAGWLVVAAGLSSGSAPVCAADPEPVPTAELDSLAIARGLSKAFKDVAEKVEPSVVHIVAKKRQPEMERVGFFESRPTGRTRIVQAGLGLARSCPRMASS